MRSVESVCRSWKSAIVPYLFHTVDLSLEREEQLKYLASTLIGQHSLCRLLVRKLRVLGNQHEVLDRYLNVLIEGSGLILMCPTSPIFNGTRNHVHGAGSLLKRTFEDNIPSHLLKALDNSCNLVHLHIFLYPEPDRDFSNLIVPASAPLWLLTDGDRLSTKLFTKGWPPKPTSALIKMSHPKLPLGYRGEHAMG